VKRKKKVDVELIRKLSKKKTVEETARLAGCFPSDVRRVLARGVTRGRPRKASVLRLDLDPELHAAVRRYAAGLARKSGVSGG